MPKGKHLPRVTLNCRNCGIEFSRVGSDRDRAHCSSKCAAVTKRRPIAPRNCLGCGMLFTPKGRGKHRHPGRYCHKGCVHRSSARQLHEQGIFKNRKIAKVVILRTLTACQSCGWNIEPAVLEMHHKDRDRANNHISNLTVICPNCHALDHYRNKDGQFKNNHGRLH